MTVEKEEFHTEYSKRWEEKFWGREGGLPQGEAFDAARSSPVLTKLLSSGEVDVKGLRAFVPGCGRGYDVVEFVRQGADVVAGLELAPTAQKEAALYLSEQLTEEESAKAQVYAGDFFKWQHHSTSSWDVGFDYTFMCALHPDMRSNWAAAWARHLGPGGLLICLAFPVVPDDGQQGPPWPVSVELYKQLLLPQGFVCEREEAVPPELSHPNRDSKEWLLIFKRQ